MLLILSLLFVSNVNLIFSRIGKDSIHTVGLIPITRKDILFTRQKNSFMADIEILVRFRSLPKKDLITEDFFRIKHFLTDTSLIDGRFSYPIVYIFPKNIFPILLDYSIKDLNANDVVVSDSLIIQDKMENDLYLSDIIPLNPSLSEFPVKYPLHPSMISDPYDLSQPILLYWEYSSNVELNGKDSALVLLLRGDMDTLMRKATLFSKGLEFDTFRFICSVKDKREKLMLKLKFKDKELTREIFLGNWYDVIYPPLLKNLKKHITILSYLFPGDSLIRRLKFAKDDSTITSLWVEFWRTRDPVKTTEKNEFYAKYNQRVEYADRNFSLRHKDGSLTDRGLIFIRLGMPDQIENHPFDTDRKAYQIWYYYDINLTVVFVDVHGIGEYELYSPKFIDIIRY